MSRFTPRRCRFAMRRYRLMRILTRRVWGDDFRNACTPLLRPRLDRSPCLDFGRGQRLDFRRGIGTDAAASAGIERPWRM